MAWGAVAGAVLGGIAGSQGSSSSQSVTRDVGHQSALGTAGSDASKLSLEELLKQLKLGPGDAAVQQGYQSQDNLSSVFERYANGGNQPTQNDINQGAGLAQAMYAPQRQQLQSNFQDMGIQADRNAARLGRAGNDPILQNKMFQEQSRQLNQLGAEQGAYARGYAQDQPQQRLGYLQQATNLRAGLASQAMSNRQTLMQLGNGLLSQDNNFRLGAATTTSSQSTPGTFASTLSGALSGAGAGMSIAGMFGGGAAAAAQPKTMAGGSYSNVGNIA